jgi:hypothetical protein
MPAVIVDDVESVSWPAVLALGAAGLVLATLVPLAVRRFRHDADPDWGAAKWETYRTMVDLLRATRAADDSTGSGPTGKPAASEAPAAIAGAAPPEVAAGTEPAAPAASAEPTEPAPERPSAASPAESESAAVAVAAAEQRARAMAAD